MPTPQKLLSNINIFHPPQYAIEGTGPSNYGKSITTGTFTVPLQMTKLDVNYNPEFVERLFKGDFDMEDEIKIWEDDSITVSGNVPINDAGLGLLDWCMNKPPLFFTDNATDSAANRKPHQSRTWLYSFIDGNNKLVYIVAKGCKPTTAKISIPNKGLAELEITMSAKQVYAVTADTAITIDSDGNPTVPAHPTTLTDANSKVVGSGVTLGFTESKDRPLRFENALNVSYKPLGSVHTAITAHPEYKINSTPKTFATELQYESVEFGVDWTAREQNSNGAIRPIYKEPSGREGNATIAIIKTNQDLNEDARTDFRRIAWIPLSPGTDTPSKIAVVNGKVILFATLPGVSGNDVKFEVKMKPTAELTKPEITVTGKKILVEVKSATTWENVKTAIDAHRSASLLGTLALGSAPGTITAAISEVMTASGADGSRKIIMNKMRFEPSNEQMQGETAATIENKTLSAFGIISRNVL